MSYQKLTVLTPVKDPDDPEKTSLAPQEVEINLDSVQFLFKQPLEPLAQLWVNLPVPLFVQGIPKLEGLVEFETTEGTTAQVNPKHVQYIYNPELGIYVLVFPGGNRLGVKETGAELQRKLSGGSGGLVV